jgi:integrase/recombinase XerC
MEHCELLANATKCVMFPLNATVRSILSAYFETLPKGSLHLFPSEKTQEALTEHAFGHLIAKYAKLAHLVDVSPHDLCHRFGYGMAEVVPLHQLAQIMGDDSLDTTMLYIRRTKQDLQQDVERIAWR